MNDMSIDLVYLRELLISSAIVFALEEIFKDCRLTVFGWSLSKLNVINVIYLIIQAFL